MPDHLDDTHDDDPRDDAPDDLATRIGRYLDGEADEAEVAELSDLLTTDPAARQLYVAMCVGAGAMKALAIKDAATRATSDDTPASLAMPSVDAVELRRARGGRGRSSDVTRYAAAAVLLIVAGVAATLMLSDRGPHDGAGPVVYQPTGEPVGTVVAQTQAVWSDDSASSLIGLGARLDAGARTLNLGYTELQMDRGASVTVAGPAVFNITGPNACRLDRGTLLAQVPPGAKGFTVTTPEMKVVDLGTRFVVHVSDDGQTEVHVLKGHVEAQAITRDGVVFARRSLNAGQAVSSAGSTDRLADVAFAPDRYLWPSDADTPKLSGEARLLAAPPVTSAMDALNSSEMLLFRERTGVEPDETISVTFFGPGRHNVETSRKKGIKPRGARYDAYLLHLDRPGRDKRLTHATVTFPRPIVGVIATRDQLNDSDQLFGSPQTKYPARIDPRFGLDPGDNVVISEDRKTMELELQGYLVDQMRILIEAE
ncbi:MAG: hypothetical protein GC159_06320 [Phycisphaera sp.]|nr:hypothetical protein [Phycisphaera sp.]